MAKADHIEGGRVTKSTGSSQQKVAKRTVERAKSHGRSYYHGTRAMELIGLSGQMPNYATHALASSIKSCEGPDAKGAEQLRQYFSKKTPEASNLSLAEMDESARMVMLQMAAEEVDSREFSYGELKDVMEKRLMAKRAEDEQGRGDGEEKVEKDVGTGLIREAKESSEALEEGRVGSRVALANDFKLCIRSKKGGG